MKSEKNCKSVFKTGLPETTREELTKVFITMITQIERSKITLSKVR